MATMTLDEAIKHAEEVMVENLEKTKGRNASDPIAINCFERADNHRQLAEWLKELKQLKGGKTGKWINGDCEGGNCNICGKYYAFYPESGDFNYCPNCGAKMQEVEE